MTDGLVIWNELSTTDEKAARNFYGTVLGWQFCDTPMPGGGEGPPYTLAVDGTAQLAGIMPMTAEAAAAMAPQWTCYLGCADVDAAVARVPDLGGQVIVPPFDVPDVGRIAVLLDPTRVMVCIMAMAGDDAPKTADPQPPDPSAFAPGRFVWNELSTPDPAAAKAFYGALLGIGATDMPMPPGVPPGSPEVYTMLNATDGRPVGGMMAHAGPGTETTRPQWVCYIAVADVDTTVAAAEAQGGAVVVPAADIEGVGRVALLRDPQGAVFGVMRSVEAGP